MNTSAPATESLLDEDDILLTPPRRATRKFFGAPKKLEQAIKDQGPSQFVWWYEAIIDELLANPSVRMQEIAKKFNRSPSWLSAVCRSDSFQARYEERRREHNDRYSQAIHEKTSQVILKSLDVLMEKLETKASVIDTETVGNVATGLLERMGYGKKPEGVVVNNTTQNNVIMASPEALKRAQAKMNALENSHRSGALPVVDAIIVKE